MRDDVWVSRASAYLRRKLPGPPQLFVLLGSGMGDLDLGRTRIDIPYARIPGFPRTRVPGHPGRLSVVGRTVILRGRVHWYEGRPMEEVVRPIRILAALGAVRGVLTNAAGAIRRGLRPGDLMAISDHLNLMGQNPLWGGPRFVDLSGIYDPPGVRGLKRGVYAAVAGPSYETPAEIRMLRKLGADAVGMSTVPEAIAAREAGLKVVAISVITNAAAGTSRKPVSHAEVLRTASAARGRLGRVLRSLIEKWGT